ncbi:MAG: IclR family transcriptional regulator [Clostridia bacterium]|nr:IclR family transcriptional regulator [Clostridia bacterium]
MAKENSIQSVDRIFGIIEKVAQYRYGVGISELAREVNLPKSTVHRTVTALVANNYLAKDETSEKYKLGYRFIAVAGSYTSKLDLREIAAPYLRNMVNKLNVTGHIAIKQGDYAVYIEKLLPYSFACTYSEIGKTIELYCSALGKSLLLGLTESELVEYYRRLMPRKFTPNTLDIISLQKELTEARATQITKDNAEHEEGVFCIATPVYDNYNKIIGALSISSHEKSLLTDSVAREMLIESARLTARHYGKL